MADGFLGRWSRRKAGKEDDALEQKAQTPQGTAQISSVETPLEEVPPPLTLEDVEKIDRFDPDFSAFMKPNVDPTVQQAALKKMFTDPHFNIMDGLDIYIDDYSKPDPLPPGMLERMVQGDMLNLFNKSSEVLAQNSLPSLDQASKSEPTNNALGAQKQSDLTSTQQKPAAQLDEVPNEASIEPPHKKT